MSQAAFIDDFFARRDIPIREDFRDEDREERFLPIPDAYDTPEIRAALSSIGITGDHLWSHQSEGLEWIDGGFNLALTTPTASGKSVVFQLPALKRLLETTDETIAVMYPVKALNSDQKRDWDKMLAAAGIDPELIAKIDGNDPLDTRDELFKKARVLVTTPDCFHSWFMSNMDKPKHQEFLANMAQCNLDETHLYDGYFGTSFSFLARRMRVLRAALRHRMGIDDKNPRKQKPLQFIAASATMHDPQKFLSRLVATRPDEDLNAIGPEECGSPSKPRRIMRVVPHGNRHIQTSVDTAVEVLKHNPNAKIMLFIDSRSKVENKTMQINQYLRRKAEEFPELKMLAEEDVCLPYRSGYSGDERTEIEEKFIDPKSSARILVTTSATEVGVNIPAVDWVISAGIPMSHSSIIQRGGRLRGGGTVIYVGRTDKNNVIQKAFEETPRDPILYRGDENAQFQAALCMTKELSDAGFDPAKINPGAASTWPKGFVEEHYRPLANGEPLQSHLHAMRKQARGNPHLSFTLRSSEGQGVRVLAYSPGLKKQVTLEQLSPSQHLREAYPGAIFLHNQRSFRVGGVSENNNAIARLDDTGAKTSPKIKHATAAYLREGSASGLKINRKKGGFIAAVDLNVTEEVYGFNETRPPGDPKGKDGPIEHFYGEKSHYSEDTVKYDRRVQGVALSFNELAGKDNAEVRGKLARAFQRAVVERYDVSTFDIASSSKNNNIAFNGFARIHHDGIITLYDRNANFKGKSQNLYRRFGNVVAHVANTTTDKDVKEWAKKLLEWSADLEEVELPTLSESAEIHMPGRPPAGYKKALFKGSIVEVDEGKGDEPYFAKVMDARVYEGEVLYQVEEIKRTAPWAKSQQHVSDTKRFVPSKRVSHFEDRFHMWAMIDTKTGQYASYDKYRTEAVPEELPGLKVA